MLGLICVVVVLLCARFSSHLDSSFLADTHSFSSFLLIPQPFLQCSTLFLIKLVNISYPVNGQITPIAVYHQMALRSANFAPGLLGQWAPVRLWCYITQMFGQAAQSTFKQLSMRNGRHICKGCPRCAIEISFSLDGARN